MTNNGEDGAPIVLAFPDYLEPARRLAARAGLGCVAIDIHRFPDGESLVRLPARLPARVVLCGSLDDANRKLIELELAAATALEHGAESLTLVAPYLCYMRQDTEFHPGEAISQRIIGRLLARRFDTLITVDPHLHRTHRLEDAVPVRRAVTLTAAPAMAAWLAALEDRPLLIGPDEESAQWVTAIAAAAGLEYGVARKERLGDREVRIELPDLAISPRHVVLVDDVASTGETLAATARLLKAAGVASIDILVTHALFVDGARERLAEAGIGSIWSTDSVPDPSNCIRLDELLAPAVVQ